MACRYHPDVNKEELAEAKFRALREAYELLLGKGSPQNDGGNGRKAPFGGNWEMHDWYWSFSMRQRQRRQQPDAAPVHSAAAAQKHRGQVTSQLTNLKRRAARRRSRRCGALASVSCLSFVGFVPVFCLFCVSFVSVLCLFCDCCVSSALL